MSTDLHYLALDDVARRLEAREFSSLEITRALLERIERIDPALGSYATVTAERALADAARLDAEAASGRSRGPLHGVPVAVKDLCNTAAIATAAGMAIHRGNVPVKDATVVTRLKEAGAVILGKLQMTEGAYGAHHPSIRAPLNPWNAAYWTGSSSSGSGVATAAGLCFASLGSDTGGSIRFPATMNGLTGLKPTWGRVSRAGIFPLAESLDHIGPMARSAVDAAIVLQAIAGADPEDPTCAAMPPPDYVRSTGIGVRGKRIGVPAHLRDLDGDAERALSEAAGVLAAAGASLVDVKLPEGFERAALDWVPICGAEAAVAHEATYPARANEYGPVLASLLDVGRSLPVSQLVKMQLRRAALAGSLNALLASVDLLLMPVMGRAVWTIDALQSSGRDPEVVAQRLRYTAPFDMSGHPTLTLPGGMTGDGVPVGFQIVSHAFDEAGILGAGHAYQQATDWHLARPPLHGG